MSKDNSYITIFLQSLKFANKKLFKIVFCIIPQTNMWKLKKVLNFGLFLRIDNMSFSQFEYIPCFDQFIVTDRLLRCFHSEYGYYRKD